MRKTQKERSRLIAEYKQSGLSQKAFCKMKGLQKSTFCYWLKKENTTPQPGGFIPLEVNRDTSPDLELTYPNGVKLSLGQATPEFISKLVKLYQPC